MAEISRVTPSPTMSLADMARAVAIVRDLRPVRLDAWLRCGHRIMDGMPFGEAESLLWAELAAAGEA